MANLGAIALAAWRAKHGVSQEEVGRRVRCTGQTIWRLEREHRMPTIRLAGAIRDATGGAVKLEDWLVEVPHEQ